MKATFAIDYIRAKVSCDQTCSDRFLFIWNGRLYDSYSFQVIPVMGQVIAGDWKSYQYLVESIRQFPNQVGLMRNFTQQFRCMSCLCCDILISLFSFVLFLFASFHPHYNTDPKISPLPGTFFFFSTTLAIFFHLLFIVPHVISA